MQDGTWLAQRFEADRPHLRGVAYRMLGSLSEADDALQEAWLRLSRADISGVDNLSGWLTTVVARVCLNMLRSRQLRREEQMSVRVPDPVISRADGMDPEQQALIADSVGLALLVVLEALAPAERVAFVLHDVFGVPFEEIAPIVGRSPIAARQLASRARRRVQTVSTQPHADLATQRTVVEAFLVAARGGDFDALVAVLDPDIVLRADPGADRPDVPREVRGAHAVASRAGAGAGRAHSARIVLVNGAIGMVSRDADGRPLSIMSFTVVGGKIAEITSLTDPARLSRLDLSVLSD